MVWITASNKKDDSKPTYSKYSKRFFPISIIPTGIFLIIIIIIYFQLIQNQHKHKQNLNSSKNFDQILQKICKYPRLPKLEEYKGVKSFYDYLSKPDTKYCYSWVEFGGEKVPITTQKKDYCSDDIRRNKYICFNKEYEMHKDPCLIYSFGIDLDSQFERDINMFSCEIHSFDPIRVTGGLHVRRSEFRFEHAWELSESLSEYHIDNRIIQKKNLDNILDILNHKGKIIKFLKADLEVGEWTLLREILANLDAVDIQQIGLQLHVPLKVNNMTSVDRHDYFSHLYKVVEGLQCAGYKYVNGRAMEYYKGRIQIPELKPKYYTGYEVNFVKVM